MFINRVGVFFIWFGIFLIALFVISEIGQQTSCGSLIFGLLALALGIFLWLRNPRSAAQDPGRFAMLRKTEKKPTKK